MNIEALFFIDDIHPNDDTMEEWIVDKFDLGKVHYYDNQNQRFCFTDINDALWTWIVWG